MSRRLRDRGADNEWSDMSIRPTETYTPDFMSPTTRMSETDEMQQGMPVATPVMPHTNPGIQGDEAEHVIVVESAQELMDNLCPESERWEFIGQGTYGQVLRCGDTAYKFQRGNHYEEALQENQYPRLLEQQCAVDDLRCGTVHVKGVGLYYLEQEHAFMTVSLMEYVPGGSAAAFVNYGHSTGQRRKYWDIRNFNENFASMVNSLHELHDRMHVIHRDIKPDNILIQNLNGPGQYELLLADFGLSCNFIEDCTGKTGSLPYIDPSAILFNQSWKDPTMDIYALGLTLWEMLMGEPYVSQRLRRSLMSLFKSAFATENPQRVAVEVRQQYFDQSAALRQQAAVMIQEQRDHLTPDDIATFLQDIQFIIAMTNPLDRFSRPTSRFLSERVVR